MVHDTVPRTQITSSIAYLQISRKDVCHLPLSPVKTTTTIRNYSSLSVVLPLIMHSILGAMISLPFINKGIVVAIYVEFHRYGRLSLFSRLSTDTTQNKNLNEICYRPSEFSYSRLASVVITDARSVNTKSNMLWSYCRVARNANVVEPCTTTL